MGGAWSEDAAATFPTSGKAMVVRVQCSHSGQRVDVTECFGSPVTSDWRAADLIKAIEQQTGVHRKCQTLMFAGKQVKQKVTLKDIVGADGPQLPARITVFLMVKRDVFPQKLGPFAMVRAPFEAEDFQIPELTEDIRAGFYWEMKTGILESYGLRARSARISGQVSPLHPLIDDAGWREATGVPAEAQEFAWSYPVANWERVESDAYAMDNWESLAAMEATTALKSFLTVGGFLFFNAQGRIVGASTPGRAQSEASSLHFREPQRWRREWTQSLAEQGRFQPVTMREIVSLGARTFCWLRPNEVIEDGDGQPLPDQPQVPNGGFVYLFREDPLASSPMDAALDRYFPVALDGKGATEDTSMGLPESASASQSLFRAFSLVEDDSADPEWSGGGEMPTPCPEGDDSDFEIPDEKASVSTVDRKVGATVSLCGRGQ